MEETDDGYLSIQDLLWRTMHGYVGILEQEKNHRDSEFIYDLKSACDDVAKASTIGDFSSAFIPLKKNTLVDSDLEKIKISYNKISEYLDKKEKRMTTQTDFNEIIKILDLLMENLNQARKPVK